MTTKTKSAKRKELEDQAAELGVEFGDSTSNGDLESLILEAMEKPDADNAAVEGDDLPEGLERVSALEGIQKKLAAYGISEDQVPETVPECERLLNIVLKARAKEAEKRKRADEGDYYGKTAKVRVLPAGDDKIGTGTYIAGIGNICFERGEEPTLELKSAEALEARGFVEILERAA